LAEQADVPGTLRISQIQGWERIFPRWYWQGWQSFSEKDGRWSFEAFSQDISRPYRGFTTLAMPFVCPLFYLWPSVDFTSCGCRYWRS